MGPRTLRRTAIAAGLATIALAAGCGGDDDQAASDDEAIAAVVEEGITTTDVETKCVTTVTSAFVERIYGDVAQCRKAEARDADDEPPPAGASTSDVQVDGDAATARVTVEGGPNDGAAGLIRFAKVDGDCRVDDLDVTFLRAQFATGIENRTYTAEDGPLAEPAFRACVLKGFGAIDDAAFKEVAFASIAEKDPDPRFVAVFSECQSPAPPAAGDGGPGGELSPVRKQFEKSLLESAARAGQPEAKVRCILAALRESTTDAELLRGFAGGANALSDPDNPLTRKLSAAGRGC